MATTIRQQNIALAYDFTPGRAPVVVFLPGFASDMTGNKALYLRDACATAGQAMLRLDYGGHGASGGRLIDGGIGDWTADALHVIGAAAPGQPLLLVGSSMGGWIALTLAKQLHQRVAALLLIAPAPDFTETLILPSLTPAQREILQRDGMIQHPGAPPISQKLLEDGAKHLLLTGEIPIRRPVRVIHGMNDGDVPWEISVQLAGCLASDDVRLIFIKDGTHRLSRPQDLALIRDTLFALLGEDTG